MGTEYIGSLYGFIIKTGFTENSEEAVIISITLFVSVICLCIVIGHLFEESRWLNQATIAISLGCLVGFGIYIVSNNSELLKFNEQLLFIYLLPPIIFNAGFQVKKKQFFHNFGTIMLFGGFGVFISTAIVTAGCMYLFPRLNLVRLQLLDYLAIGIIFSATDTVANLQVLNQDETPLLYSIVFGEGVVNDATSVVLFRAVEKLGNSGLNGKTALNMITGFAYLFSLSTLLGVLIGLLTAYVLRTLYFGRHCTDREISIMALMAYLSYILAELFHLSGILSVFFCGILMSHYSWHNVSDNSKITSTHSFATMSFISESFMFLYVGTDIFNVNIWRLVDIRAAGIICMILLALIPLGRAAFVFPFSALSNYVRAGRSSVLLSFRHQVIIWWAGLMRGAVSIALAYQQFTTNSGDARDANYATMICSTTGVVLATVVLGTFTKALVERVLPQHLLSTFCIRPSKSNEQCLPLTEEPDSSSNEGEPQDGPNLRRRSSLTLLLTHPTSAVHSLWRGFDDLYMRPVFGGLVRNTTPWQV